MHWAICNEIFKEWRWRYAPGPYQADHRGTEADLRHAQRVCMWPFAAGREDLNADMEGVHTRCMRTFGWVPLRANRFADPSMSEPVISTHTK